MLMQLQTARSALRRDWPRFWSRAHAAIAHAAKSWTKTCIVVAAHARQVAADWRNLQGPNTTHRVNALTNLRSSVRRISCCIQRIRRTSR